MEKSPEERDAVAEVFAGGGEMGVLMRSHDWSSTPLGSVERWPQSLRTAVSILLNSKYPMFIAWGPDLIFLYNDGYRPIFGAKHPAALGQPFAAIWAEIWSDIQPLVERALAGEPTWSNDLVLFLDRHGYLEETYFTFSYSPIRDETGGIGGMFCACIETTQRVLAERRMRTLQDLGTAAVEAKTVADAESRCMEVLGANPLDLPFAVLYRIGGGSGSLAGSVNAPVGSHVAPASVEITRDADGWPLGRTERDETVMVEDLTGRFGDTPLSIWGEPARRALVLPITGRSHPAVGAALVLGISPRLAVDAEYEEFLHRVAGSVTTALANARAYEEERSRAEALAELDRAKTAFFGNISHEFRTPLTLILGPVEDGLNDPEEPLTPSQRQRQEIVHRSSLRLQKLVNTLLDFSRIEAGRAQASYRPTDLAALTAELASMFRPATEKAGLRLVVETPPLPEPVFVDRDMWEKVVLNLLSNAFKHTFAGEIGVRLRAHRHNVELEVWDTGTGIPGHELPHLFERFHRVQGAPARTHEGSGIGLALVQELVRLHGGDIRVESTEGVGSTFTVSIPSGSEHLPEDRIDTSEAASIATRSAAYVEEAVQWLVDQHADGGVASLGWEVLPGRVGGEATVQKEGRILVVDDNSDMRQYLTRLLASRWDVETAAEGAAALETVRRHPPDLVLCDVMMPGMDGFELLAALRSDPQTRELPIILLSARAGEEARIEGLQAGADDYMVKPFSARELLARVSAHLQMSRLRRETEAAVRESEARYRALVTATSDVVYRMSPDWSEMRYLDGRDFIDETVAPSGGWLRKYIHPDDAQMVTEAINRAIRTKSTFELEHRVKRTDGTLGWTFSRAIPLLDERGEIVEWFGAASDVTSRREAEEALRESEERFRLMADTIPQAIWLTDSEGRIEFFNKWWADYCGVPEGTRISSQLAASFTHPEDRERVVTAFAEARRNGRGFEVEQRNRSATGDYRWFLSRAEPYRDPQTGEVTRWFGAGIDIHDRKLAEERERRAREEAQSARAAAEAAGARIRELFMKAPAIIASLRGPEHVFESANPPYLQLVGEREILGKPVAIALPELEQQGFVELLDQVYRSGTPFVANELPVLLNRGGEGAHHEEIFLNFVYQPLREADGAVSGILVHAVDVTDQVRSRQQVEQARKEAEDANQAKSAFLATMSHELRTPLNAIIGYTDLLEIGAVGPVTEPQSRQLKRITASAKHLLQLIEEVLTFSRIEAGKLEVRLDEADIRELVRDAASMIAPLAEAKGLRFRYELPEKPLTMCTDEGKVRQILINLLGNAVKFTDAGEVRLTARAQEGGVAFEVADTGIGISPDDMGQIFEPFQQASLGTTRNAGGTGLGLSVSRELARLLGGDVTGQSSPGQGSRFLLHLPRPSQGCES